MTEMREDLQNLAKRFSWEDLDEFVNHYAKQMTADAIQYLASRGITEKTIENFRLGFESTKIGFHAGGKGMLGGYFSNCIVFPIVDEHGKVVDLVGRSIDSREPKYRSLLGHGDKFFNHPVIKATEDIILVRNVFDVLSLAQEQLPALSLPDMSPFREQHAAELSDKRVFICYPNDDSGRRESMRIASMLENIAKEVYIVQLPEGLRDVNDLFVRASKPVEVFMDLLNEVVSETLKMPVFPDARSLTVFTEEYAKRQKGIIKGIATGFADLDDSLVGGLHTGLYLLMGNVSTGKSMFLRQMADQIAASGTPVVYVSWEMTAYELWCRSMARILQVPPRDVKTGKVELEKITAASQAYAASAKNMWTIEGTLEVTLHEIGEIIHRIIQSIGRVPVIFIDDLFRITIRDDKGNIVHNNQAVNAYLLHEWSRQWDTPVFISAPLNSKNGFDIHPLVEAAVDAIMHFHAETLHAQTEGEISEIKISLLKNRNGSKGEVKLLFNKEKAEFYASQP